MGSVPRSGGARATLLCGMPILNLVHVNLHVTDLERSIDFYERLGFEVMFDLGRHRSTSTEPIRVSDRVAYGGGESKAVVLSLGDDPRCATKIELMQYVDPPPLPKPPKPPEEAGAHRLAMRVKDLDGTIADLKARGVPIDDAPHEVRTMGGRQRYVLFTDPDDNLLELIELHRA